MDTDFLEENGILMGNSSANLSIKLRHHLAVYRSTHCRDHSAILVDLFYDCKHISHRSHYIYIYMYICGSSRTFLGSMTGVWFRGVLYLLRQWAWIHNIYIPRNVLAACSHLCPSAEMPTFFWSVSSRNVLGAITAHVIVGIHKKNIYI